MTNQPTTTRREFLLEASMSGVALGALAGDVLASQQPASATGVPDARALAGRLNASRSSASAAGTSATSRTRTRPSRSCTPPSTRAITFFDNCWDYHDGGSEEIMGKALAAGGKWRKKCFLMTKVCSREAKEVRKQIEESLQRLQTDVIDLMQMHEINWDNDPDWVVEKGGLADCSRCRRKARSGSSGSPGTRSPTSTCPCSASPSSGTPVSFPSTSLDLHYRSFQKQVLPVCLKRKIGAIGMKGIGRGQWHRATGGAHA